MNSTECKFGWLSYLLPEDVCKVLRTKKQKSCSGVKKAIFNFTNVLQFFVRSLIINVLYRLIRYGRSLLFWPPYTRQRTIYHISVGCSGNLNSVNHWFLSAPWWNIISPASSIFRLASIGVSFIRFKSIFLKYNTKVYNSIHVYVFWAWIRNLCLTQLLLFIGT